jgi:hypothetical protein
MYHFIKRYKKTHVVIVELEFESEWQLYEQINKWGIEDNEEIIIAKMKG